MYRIEIDLRTIGGARASRPVTSDVRALNLSPRARARACGGGGARERKTEKKIYRHAIYMTTRAFVTQNMRVGVYRHARIRVQSNPGSCCVPCLWVKVRDYIGKRPVSDKSR